MGHAPHHKLLTYRYCYVIVHLNKHFTRTYLSSYKHKRTKEQMDQAARSTKQNIAEGASQQTSLKGYIKLTGVARGSLEELREDYIDFLLFNQLPVWEKADQRFRREKRYRIFVNDTPTSPPPPIPRLPPDPEIFANLMIDVCTRTCYLLDQQRRSLVKKHEHEGGFTEQLYKARRRRRGY